MCTQTAWGAFHQGLKETGFVEGQNVAVEFRWAQGQSRETRANFF